MSDVLGIGNAIVDVLAHTDDAFLADHGMAKGSMTLIDSDRVVSLYRGLGETVQCSGGSAANTMVGLASLGAEVAYVGKVRDDPVGSLFIDDIRNAGVDFRTPPAHDGPSTGRCLVLVTPDAQRTMQTFLGASATLAPDDIHEAMVAPAAITYLEGYLFDPAPAKAAFRKAAEIAHSAGRRVALSLSDPSCVDRHRAEFVDLVKHHVDVLFANDEEIVSLYETGSFEEAVDRLGGQCEVAALTRGAAGSLIVSRGERVEVPAVTVDAVVDTTGAGDLFAAGFLFGLTRGRDLAECGRLGSVAAGEAISHFGARPRTSLSELVAKGSES